MILRNAAWGFLGEVAVRGAKLAQVLLVVRLLGPAPYGAYTHAAAAVSLFSILFDFAVSSTAVRDLAAAADARDVLRRYVAFKLLASAVSLAAMLGWILVVYAGTGERLLALMVGLNLWAVDATGLLLAIFRAGQEFWRETVFKLWTSALQLGAGLAVLLWRPDIQAFALAVLAGSAAGVVVLVRELRRRDVPVALGPWRESWGLARECAPLVGAAALGTIYGNFDVFMLGKAGTLADVALYSVVVKTVFGLLIMPVHFLTVAALPALVAAGPGEEGRWAGGYAATAAAGAGACLGLAAAADPLVVLAFGPKFAGSGPVLRDFAVAGALFYLYYPLIQWCLVRRRQGASMLVTAAATVVNVLLVWLLVPRAGVAGATVAALGTHAVLLAGHLWLLAGPDGGPWLVLRGPLLRVAVGFGLGWGILRGFPSAHGGLALAAAAFLFGAFTWPELVMVFRQAVRYVLPVRTRQA